MIRKNETFANIVVKGTIVEFDMSAAGPSVTRAENIISDDFYRELLSYTDKHLRQVKFGLYLGKHNLQPKKEEALDKYMNLFISENGIDDSHIMEIASDALWMYNPPRIRHRDFNEFVKFRMDRTASIMVSFEGIKFYANTWNGEFFTRGYKLDEKDANVMSSLLQTIESEENIKALYKYLHRFKMMVLREEVTIKNKEYGSQLADFLLISLI